MATDRTGSEPRGHLENTRFRNYGDDLCISGDVSSSVRNALAQISAGHGLKLRPSKFVTGSVQFLGMQISPSGKNVSDKAKN